MFARLGLSADNLYLSGAKIEEFGEEFEQGFVGGASFSGSGDSNLEGLAEAADDTVAGGGRHDFDSQTAATGGVGDFQV